MGNTIGNSLYSFIYTVLLHCITELYKGPGSSYNVNTLIVGGGPTGLGAAYRLTQLKEDDWVLVDADKQPGGLAGSFKTPEGFRFDHGFMIIPTRYDFIEQLLQELGPPAETEKKSREFIEFIEKLRDNFVYIRYANSAIIVVLIFIKVVNWLNFQFKIIYLVFRQRNKPNVFLI